MEGRKKEDISGLHQHFFYYQDKDRFKDLIKQDYEIPYQYEAFNYIDLKNQLIRNGLEPFYKELTTPDIAKNTPLRVVKVVVPEMIDLSKKYDYLRLACSRFWQVPQKLNLPVQEKLYTEPHPFP